MAEGHRKVIIVTIIVRLNAVKKKKKKIKENKRNNEFLPLTRNRIDFNVSTLIVKRSFYYNRERSQHYQLFLFDYSRIYLYPYACPFLFDPPPLRRNDKSISDTAFILYYHFAWSFYNASKVFNRREQGANPEGMRIRLNRRGSQRSRLTNHPALSSEVQRYLLQINYCAALQVFHRDTLANLSYAQT